VDAAPAAVAAPRVVHIKVASTPSGGEVFVGGDAEPRGRTPIDLELPFADGETEVIVRLAGYKEIRRVVKLNIGGDFELKLDKDRSAAVLPKDKPPRDKPPRDKPPKDKPQGSDDVLAPKF
jgi:hypothetical protein